MKYLIFLFYFVTPNVFAETSLCGQIESKYRHPLAEKDFTKEHFDLALTSLKQTDKHKAYDYDFYDIESDLMYIRGYMFKLYIKNNPKDVARTAEFCKFMSTEAYLRHE